jgi:hypothetical protein
MAFEHIFKFDVFVGFLSLSEDSFFQFKSKYVKSKEYLTGEVNLRNLKIIQKQGQNGRLSKLFDEEVIAETEQKLFKDEQEFGKYFQLCNKRK